MSFPIENIISISADDNDQEGQQQRTSGRQRAPGVSTSINQLIIDNDDGSNCKWRQRGKARREAILRRDELNGGSTFSLKKYHSIQRYFDLSDKMFQQFQSMYERKTNLESAYVVGNRLVCFLSGTLPKHSDYFKSSSYIPPLRQKAVQQLEWVEKQMDVLALLIDKEQHSQYVFLANSATSSSSSQLHDGSGLDRNDYNLATSNKDSKSNNDDGVINTTAITSETTKPLVDASLDMENVQYSRSTSWEMFPEWNIHNPKDNSSFEMIEKSSSSIFPFECIEVNTEEEVSNFSATSPRTNDNKNSNIDYALWGYEERASAFYNNNLRNNMFDDEFDFQTQLNKDNLDSSTNDNKNNVSSDGNEITTNPTSCSNSRLTSEGDTGGFIMRQEIISNTSKRRNSTNDKKNRLWKGSKLGLNRLLCIRRLSSDEACGDDADVHQQEGVSLKDRLRCGSRPVRSITSNDGRTTKRDQPSETLPKKVQQKNNESQISCIEEIGREQVIYDDQDMKDAAEGKKIPKESNHQVTADISSITSSSLYTTGMPGTCSNVFRFKNRFSETHRVQQTLPTQKETDKTVIKAKLSTQGNCRIHTWTGVRSTCELVSNADKPQPPIKFISYNNESDIVQVGSSFEL